MALFIALVTNVFVPPNEVPTDTAVPTFALPYVTAVPAVALDAVPLATAGTIVAVTNLLETPGYDFTTAAVPFAPTATLPTEALNLVVVLATVGTVTVCLCKPADKAALLYCRL